MFSKFSLRGRNKASEHETNESLPEGEAQTRGIAKAASKLSIGEGDVVIAIMGVTGTGKSAFIEELTNSDGIVGHGLRSCTAEVGIYAFRYRDGRKIYLIDTPGFNDTVLSDTEVLTQIAYFLGATYSNKIKLAGIIYLHRIIDVRMGGNALRNLHMFNALCGSLSMSNVVLATTMWDTLQSSSAIQRGEKTEKELRTEKDFWGDMVDMGSKMFRHYGNTDTALEIVDYIMEIKGYIVLDIQRQMVDDKQALNETPVGKEVQKDLLAAKKKYDAEIAATKQSMKLAIENGQREMAAKLARNQAESQKRLDDANRQTQLLKENFEKIQKEGDERQARRFAELEAESKRQRELVAEREQEIAGLAAKQAKHEADMAAFRRANANKNSEWAAKMTAERIQAEREQGELERKRKERDAAIARQRNTDRNISMFKVVAGVVMTGMGAYTLNGALAGAGTLLLAGSVNSDHERHLKPE